MFSNPYKIGSCHHVIDMSGHGGHLYLGETSLSVCVYTCMCACTHVHYKEHCFVFLNLINFCRHFANKQSCPCISNSKKVVSNYISFGSQSICKFGIKMLLIFQNTILISKERFSSKCIATGSNGNFYVRRKVSSFLFPGYWFVSPLV